MPLISLKLAGAKKEAEGTFGSLVAADLVYLYDQRSAGDGGNLYSLAEDWDVLRKFHYNPTRGLRPLIQRSRKDQKMKLYTNAKGQWVGTQAEAKTIGAEQTDVPTDKPSLVGVAEPQSRTYKFFRSCQWSQCQPQWSLRG